MPTPSEATYIRLHAEVVEFVDQSRQAEIDGVRGVNFNSNLSLDMKPEQGLIIPKLRLLMERPDGKFVIKLVVRCRFKVSLYARLKGNDEYMGLPVEIYHAMFRETWDYARDFLKSCQTPIAHTPIPDMPQDIMDSGLPALSMN